MDFILALGLTAAALSSFTTLPQLIKSIKTKSTTDLSLGMFCLLTTGAVLWLIYGVVRKDVPLISANIITLMIAVPILILKLKYK